MTCEKNLVGSRYVRGRLNTLAPISGSQNVWSAGSCSLSSANKVVEGRS
jgi:hypothetical protein